MGIKLPKRLDLRGWDWFGHYGLPIYFTGLSAFLFFLYFFVPSPKPSEDVAILSSLVVVLMFVAVAVLQRQIRVLALKHYNTGASAETNFKIIVALANAESWRLGISDYPRMLRLHVPARWYEPCWGEMVTVFFEGHLVAISSICDPTKTKPSIFSFGRNARNLDKVKVAYERSER